MSYIDTLSNAKYLEYLATRPACTCNRNVGPHVPHADDCPIHIWKEVEKQAGRDAYDALPIYYAVPLYFHAPDYDNNVIAVRITKLDGRLYGAYDSTCFVAYANNWVSGELGKIDNDYTTKPWRIQYKLYESIEAAQAVVDAKTNNCDHDWDVISHEEEVCLKCGSMRFFGPDY